MSSSLVVTVRASIEIKSFVSHNLGLIQMFEVFTHNVHVDHRCALNHFTQSSETCIQQYPDSPDENWFSEHLKVFPVDNCDN